LSHQDQPLDDKPCGLAQPTPSPVRTGWRTREDEALVVAVEE
jgi:hypothetical protein